MASNTLNTQVRGLSISKCVISCLVWLRINEGFKIDIVETSTNRYGRKDRRRFNFNKSVPISFKSIAS